MNDWLTIITYNHGVDDLFLQELDDFIIWWLFIESHAQNIFGNLPQLFRAHHDHLFGILDVQSFSQVIAEPIILIFECFYEIRPWQFVIIEQINHYV
jgi:hypothetical protein